MFDSASPPQSTAVIHGVDRLIIDAAPDGILLVDPQGLILLGNPALEQITGYTAAELHGQSLGIFLPPEMREQHQRQMAGYFLKPKRRRMGQVARLDLRHRDGRMVPVGIALGHCEVAGVPCAVAFIRDLSDLRRLEAQIEYQALHDTLTGLSNRWQFNQVLGRALVLADRYQRTLAVMLLDLDEFKAVNDVHGHAVGDMMLVEVARRLKGALRTSDTLARLGGDEFIVLLSELGGPADALRVAGKLQEALAPVCYLQGCEVYPSASIGIACFPADARDQETLLRYADMAMYRAKAQGRGVSTLYDVEMGRQVQARIHLFERLKSTLRHDGLHLHYQPQIDVATGAVVGVEALLRWHDEELGNVSPEDFIPLAESSGLIHEIGDWVLDTACRQWQLWARAGMRLRMAINLSARQFRRADLGDRLQSLLLKHAVPPSWLELEITESEAMADPKETHAILEQLTALGVKVTLDDFGKGHSSLSYLQLMPIRRIKIDRDFMRQIPAHGSSVVLVQAVLALARTLDLDVVAEGVETDEQLDFLRQHGCTLYQGWLFAPALPPERIGALWHGAGAAPPLGLSDRA